MKYKVVKEYSDAPENPIEIKKGEVLEVMEKSDPAGDWPNWIFCRGLNKEGWVPDQVLKVEGKTAVVLKGYIATEHNLALDEILVPDYELNGWIWCSKEGSGKPGWAPLNCLAEIK